MGQKQSHPEAGTKTNFTPNALSSKKSYDPHYGDVKLIQDSATGETVVLREIISNNKEEFEAELASLNSRVPIRHPNLINVMRVDSQTKSGYCSTHYKISLFIEYVEQNLEAELKNRISSQRQFNENEILTIADDLLTVLSDFQVKGISHGDVRPLNIFNAKGVYKLSDPSLSCQKGLNGLALAIIKEVPTLLPPELVPQLAKKNYDLDGVRFDEFKADSYSLGVTLLSLATLTQPEGLYDYKQGTINKKLLKERLEIVRQNYSDLTFTIIESMLDDYESSRKSPAELSSILRSYSHIFRPQSLPSIGSHAHSPNLSSTQNIDHQKEVEVIKKAPFESTIFAHTYSHAYENKVSNNDGYSDDLHAKIQAALARSQDTIRNLSPNKTIVVHDEKPVPSYVYTPQTQTQNQNLDSHHNPYTLPLGAYSGESLKRATLTSYDAFPTNAYRTNHHHIDMTGLSGYTPNIPYATISDNIASVGTERYY